MDDLTIRKSNQHKKIKKKQVPKIEVLTFWFM